MKKYLVVWVTDKIEIDMFGNETTVFTDHYRAFVYHDNNLKLANELYNELLNQENVYSVNVCQIIKSTDY